LTSSEVHGPAKNRTFRNLNDSSGIFVCRRNQMASLEHPRAFIGTHHLTQRALGSPLSKLCIGELRFPTVRANRHRASSDAHRILRSPPGPSGPTRTPSGVRRQPAPLEPFGADSGLSGLIARPARRGELRFATVRDDRHRVSPDTHRSLRALPNLLEILMLSIQSQRTALTESLQRPFVVGSFTEMCTNSDSKVVTARRPQTSVTLSETKS
jgi:hypothetical protein